MFYVFDTPIIFRNYMNYTGFPLYELEAFLDNCIMYTLKSMRYPEYSLSEEDVLTSYNDPDRETHVDITHLGRKFLIETCYCIARMINILSGLFILKDITYKNIYLYELKDEYFIIEVQ